MARVSVPQQYTALTTSGNIANNVTFFEGRGIAPGARILEVGSGTGRFCQFLHERGHRDVVGVEISESGLALAREAYPHIDFRMMSGDDLDFPDGAFDVVVSWDVLEHIAAVEKHVEEVARVLVPHGRYVLQTPNKFTNVPWELMHRRKFDFLDEHCSLQSLWSLRRLLRRAGFTCDVSKMDVKTEWARREVEQRLGKFARWVFEIAPLNAMPLWLATNFYVDSRLTE